MENRFSAMSSAILGLCIGVGVAVAGVSIANALIKSRAPARNVTVRGLAEREVDADLAIWPITFAEATNDLIELNNRISKTREIVSSFLQKSGFKNTDISFSAPKINDSQTIRNAAAKVERKYRYVAQATVTVRSDNVAAVKRTIENLGTLVGKGVVLVSDNYENRSQFLFTGLNKIKPEMIETATKNAREAAAKFAKDSGSELGKIRTASQGLFEITDRDQNSPDRKVVRVVTTVEYFLVDK